MAIKVNGTTVIDDSRNLVNIVSGAGSSTTYGDVGTYTTAMRSLQNTSYAGGTTVAASSLVKFHDSGGQQAFPLKDETVNTQDSSSTGLSGTWRLMSPLQQSNTTNRNIGGLYVRIS